MNSSRSGNAKQLRLGFVCYGGSSLCIYMHGITKEIHRLVKASAVRERGGRPAGPSESVYQRLRERLKDERADGLDLRIVVDVISGTSRVGSTGSSSRRRSPGISPRMLCASCGSSAVT